MAKGWQGAALSPAERAMCAWAEKLTLTPGAMTEADVQQLRDAGWSDLEVHDAAQVVAYFNYVNRLADGLGVDLEDFMAPNP
ncbi:MAG: hypothetical protein QF489_02370 [Planctomycetota bacterium]|nr:hypothetical protein [Planctomycetota bacterium]